MKGKIVHVEIPAEDTQRAMKFWASSPAGSSRTTPKAPRARLSTNMFEGEPGGAIYPAREGETGIMVYFETDDIDAETARIRDLGGNVEEKMPVPSMGWFAQGKDTEGNPFAVWQSDESAPMPEGMGAQSASSS